ncbi:MAG: hypothetical protein WBC04_18060 [Candidatus Acidiferrales bacterium]
MGEKADQIERHIRDQRNELGEHINELQEKVKRAVDWRVQFEERPMTMIGIAFGGGVLLSALIGGRSRSRHPKQSLDPQRSPSGDQRAARADFGINGSAAYNKNKSSESWRNIKGALAGVVATKFGRILDSIILGFNEEYGKTRTGNGSFRDPL